MRFPLELAPGLISDETTHATPGQFVDGNNVRFWRGKPQTIGGWTKANASALTGICRNVISWLDNGGVPIQAFGSTEALQVLFDDVLYNITPAGLPDGNEDSLEAGGWGVGGYGTGGYGGGFVEYFPRTWSLANWGEYLMASPRGYPVYLWENDPTSVATEITQSPNEIMHMLVTPERQVVAFGCNEESSGDFNWLCIRWSDVQDYTDWTTAADNNAGEYILESGGKIVAAKLFGPYIAIWTDTSVHLMQFIGDPGETFRFELVADNCGLAGPNAVTVVNQTAYWLTPDLQFYAWQFGAPPQPMPCPIRNDFKDNVDTDELAKVVCTSVSEFNEIWWFYPDTRDGDENSRYVAVSLNDGTWFRGELARTAAIDSGPQRYPIFVSPDGYIYSHESGQTADGEDLEWSVETGDLYLSEAGNRVLVRGVWPDFEDQSGVVVMSIWSKSYPQATEKAKGPWSLAAGREKRDFMFETRIARVKFSGTGSYARLGKPSFDVTSAGEV